MTLRELVELTERQSLSPNTLDLPLILTRKRKRKYRADEERRYEVMEVRIDSGGVEVTIVPLEPWVS